MSDRYPGYDVLKKRHTPSWNDQTRAVIEKRLAIDPHRHRFLSDSKWATLRALWDCIIPQPSGRDPVPLAAIVDEKLHEDVRGGHRDAGLPPLREAWRCGLAALDAEARSHHGRQFHKLTSVAQDEILTNVQAGHAHHAAWGDMAPALFFTKRVLHDVVAAYYAHPTAWNEIGFGGPASPRGYVRLNFDRRDPWEASEARPGREATARKENAGVG